MEGVVVVTSYHFRERVIYLCWLYVCSFHFPSLVIVQVRHFFSELRSSLLVFHTVLLVRYLIFRLHPLPHSPCLPKLHAKTFFTAKTLAALHMNASLLSLPSSLVFSISCYFSFLFFTMYDPPSYFTFFTVRMSERRFSIYNKFSVRNNICLSFTSTSCSVLMAQ